MTPADAMICAIRGAGIDVFIIPRPGPAEGVAWVDGRAFINVYGAGRDLDVARVLAHEFGHHICEHFMAGASVPHWVREFEAELRALELLSDCVAADTMVALRARARAYIRPKVQAFLDAGIYLHGEIPAGEWAGCDISPAARAWWADWTAERADDGEIPF